MKEMNIEYIKQQLPHRYPFLFVDKVLEIGENHIIAVKNCTNDEPFFQGHFPDYPIMPGVLQVEAIAQVAGLFLMENRRDDVGDNILPLFLGIDKARFHHEVRPGDRLTFNVSLIEQRSNMFWLKGKVTKENEITCTKAKIMVGFKES